MAYLVPGAVVTKWFPRHRGLANGVTLFGFGAGSLVYNAIVAAIPQFARAADVATPVIMARHDAARAGTSLILSPHAHAADIHAVMAILFWSGVVMIAIGGLSALGIEAPRTVATAIQPDAERDYSPRKSCALALFTRFGQSFSSTVLPASRCSVTPYRFTPN